MSIQIPGYLMQREIGAGGMARVFLATQTSLDRDVAVKVMSPALAADPSFSKRFMREARVIASLQHPNIVAIYDIGSIDHLHYFTMQLLPGGDLAQRLRDGIKEAELKSVLDGISRALAFAHERGIVHRDVTPGNIMFDAAQNPVLTDFGIARTNSGSTKITHTGVSIGTSSYMSPEQARGQDTDARSDLYSLGALVFEALTGKPPYTGGDSFAVAYAHVFEPIPALPPALAHWQTFINRALAKKPEDRFADGHAFRAGLDLVPNHHLTIPQRSATLLPAAEPDLARSSDQTRAVILAPADALPAPAREHTAEWIPPPLKRQWLPGAFLALLSIGLISVVIAVWPQRSVEPPAPTTNAEPVGSSTQSPAVAQTDPSNPPLNLDADQPPELIPVDEQGMDEPTPFVGPPSREETASGWLARAKVLTAQGLLTAGNENALGLIARAAALDPKRVDLAPYYDAVYQAMVRLYEADMAAEKLSDAVEKLDRLLLIAKPAPQALTLTADVERRRAEAIASYRSKAEQAQLAWQGQAAQAALRALLVLSPNDAQATQALTRAAQIGKPAYRFTDALGSKQGPPMRVVSSTLAFAEHEVTVDEYRAFVAATGHKTREAGCNNIEGLAMFTSRDRTWQSPGYPQTGNHPVVCIAAADAQAYADWLKRQTGKPYRLASAAEWSAVGTQAASEKPCGKANLADTQFANAFKERDTLPCDDGESGAAAIGRYGAGPFGLYDLGGNVREWSKDCADSSCRRGVAIGRGWANRPKDQALDSRLTVSRDALNNTVGFRVIRELPELTARTSMQP